MTLMGICCPEVAVVVIPPIVIPVAVIVWEKGTLAVNCRVSEILIVKL